MPDLFTIETEAIRLSWRRRTAGDPAPAAPAPLPARFGDDVPRLAVARLDDGPAPALAYAGDAPPLLQEQTDYLLFARSKDGRSLTVRHRDPVLTAGFHALDDGRAQHGIVNFGAQLGRSRFVVDVDARPHVAFDVEVFPTKFDYRADFLAVLHDLRDIHAGLALAYLRPTVSPASVVPAANASTPEWIVLLQHALGDLEDAMAHAARQPLRDTIRTERFVRAERVRRPDDAVRRAAQQGRGHGKALVAGVHVVREYLPARAGRSTLDTPEHRWLAARFYECEHRIAALHRAETTRAGRRQARIAEELRTLARRAGRLAASPLLSDAEGAASTAPTTRMLHAPGYREAYQACLHLQRGLAVAEGPLETSIKDLHLLYEYWCYLCVVRTASALTANPLPPTLLRPTADGLSLRLQSGRRQAVRMRGPDGARIAIRYNPHFSGHGYLVSQRPDIVIIRKDADGHTTLFVLDAKYRLDTSASYERRYGTTGPPAGTLNTLHRYRDAIRSRTAGRSQRRVAEAVVLYPWRPSDPAAYERGRHWQTLTAAGIGAIPLLPGADTFLTAWLQRILRP